MDPFYSSHKERIEQVISDASERIAASSAQVRVEREGTRAEAEGGILLGLVYELAGELAPDRVVLFANKYGHYANDERYRNGRDVARFLAKRGATSA